MVKVGPQSTFELLILSATRSHPLKLSLAKLNFGLLNCGLPASWHGCVVVVLIVLSTPSYRPPPPRALIERSLVYSIALLLLNLPPTTTIKWIRIKDICTVEDVELLCSSW